MRKQEEEGKGKREEALKKDFSGSLEEGWRRVGAAAVWAPLATRSQRRTKLDAGGGLRLVVGGWRSLI